MVNLNKARWGFAYLEWSVLDIVAPVQVILLITIKTGLFVRRIFLIGFLEIVSSQNGTLEFPRTIYHAYLDRNKI